MSFFFLIIHRPILTCGQSWEPLPSGPELHPGWGVWWACSLILLPGQVVKTLSLSLLFLLPLCTPLPIPGNFPSWCISQALLFWPVPTVKLSDSPKILSCWKVILQSSYPFQHSIITLQNKQTIMTNTIHNRKKKMECCIMQLGNWK